MSTAKGCLRATTGLILLAALALCAFTLWTSPSQDSPPPTPTATTVRLFAQQNTPPTPTQDPVSAQVQAQALQLALYTDIMKQHLGALSTAMKEIGQLMAAANVNDETWRSAVAVQLVAIRNAHAAMLAVSAPDGWQDIHGQIIASTGKCNDATYLLASGIDEQDVSLLQGATALIIECTEGQSAALDAMMRRIQDLTLVPLQ